MNKAYKDGACGRIGFNFTIRQSSPGTCQVGTAFSSGPITCIAAQVAVCSKGLSRTVTHLEKTNSRKGSPEDSHCQLEPLWDEWHSVHTPENQPTWDWEQPQREGALPRRHPHLTHKEANVVSPYHGANFRILTWASDHNSWTHTKDRVLISSLK